MVSKIITTIIALMSTISFYFISSPTKSYYHKLYLSPSLSDNVSISHHLYTLTRRPHLAGSEANAEAASYVLLTLSANNIKSHLAEYAVLLTYPDSRSLTLIRPSPAYELEHVDLAHTMDKGDVALVDAVLWCCRPRSLSLVLLYRFTDKGDVVKYTYEKLLQQEDEGQTNIKFSLIYLCKDYEQHFSDLNSLLKAISLDQFSCKITFIKEEVVQEAD